MEPDPAQRVLTAGTTSQRQLPPSEGHANPTNACRLSPHARAGSAGTRPAHAEPSANCSYCKATDAQPGKLQRFQRERSFPEGPGHRKHRLSRVWERWGDDDPPL